MGGSAEKPNAPGQLVSHYAPGAAVRLEARVAETGEILVGFGPVRGDLTLSETGDLVEAAANLFHILREADLLAGPDGRIARVWDKVKVKDHARQVLEAAQAL